MWEGVFLGGFVFGRVRLWEGVFVRGFVCGRVCFWAGVFMGGCDFGGCVYGYGFYLDNKEVLIMRRGGRGFGSLKGPFCGP